MNEDVGEKEKLVGLIRDAFCRPCNHPRRRGKTLDFDHPLNSDCVCERVEPLIGALDNYYDGTEPRE